MGEEYVFRIGHSPDPDDAFMFHALTTGLLDTQGRKYVHELYEIEQLNRYALEGKFEVSAVSIHSYPTIADRYQLMNCGASMGEGYGPILVSRTELPPDEAKTRTIAIPGLGTSAYLALRIAWGDVDVHVVPFDQIIPAVVRGEYDLGLIIHEGQITWANEGLHLILDLGAWWYDRTGLPLPLGGNVVRKDLGDDICQKVTDDIRRSIQYSLSNPDSALEFAKLWGRGIDDDTNREFVGMYVNERTLDYGEEGREAVRRFLIEGQNIGVVGSSLDVSKIEFLGVE
ncbi:MAG: ABC transporter substrate-binding protein [Marine Group II euryarchaeote MED-G34]|jgi:1,4-dihydroxy-6-naphthoate synthase|nr:MAG: ABC transporter substrate-binding protein [Marine Group II euryarchaeote MED-G34]|tara:strand:- start:2850 stop:3704 length:855 start_codon:yes stop_codon:yes gene_type:complete